MVPMMLRSMVFPLKIRPVYVALREDAEIRLGALGITK